MSSTLAVARLFAGVILCELWMQEELVLVKGDEPAHQGSPNGQDAYSRQMEALAKTARGYRPRLSDNGPFGAVPTTLSDLVVSAGRSRHV
jgi:hypothetical protein